MQKYPEVEGVLHCFTESWDMAEQALKMGYYISISGIVTFKNAENVREVARRVPIERLLIETDAPWLAPVPNRGKDNEPAFVADTAKYLAELRGISLEELAARTSANFNSLFKPR
jgi:TatD DNase family protein